MQMRPERPTGASYPSDQIACFHGCTNRVRDDPDRCAYTVSYVSAP
jgi:hypothetical protein